MAKLLAAGGFFVEVATAVGSLGGNSGQGSMVAWLALNGLLLMVPLVYRVCELLLVAVTDAPQVMTLDLSDDRA